MQCNASKSSEETTQEQVKDLHQAIKSPQLFQRSCSRLELNSQRINGLIVKEKPIDEAPNSLRQASAKLVPGPGAKRSWSLALSLHALCAPSSLTTCLLREEFSLPFASTRPCSARRSL